jgi:putative phage-type endonuclease
LSLSTQLQKTPQWHLDRSGRLTASLFGAALGLSPYCSRQELWRQLTGRSAAFTGNEMTAWGEEHEKDAIHHYEVVTGLLVEPSGFVPWDSWSGCSPDGWVLDGKQRGLIETKCPWSQRVHESIPEYYLAQIIGQLGITGAAWCDFVSWTPHEARIIRVDPQPATWNRMEKALKEFWQYVMQGVEPKRAKRFNLQEQ